MYSLRNFHKVNSPMWSASRSKEYKITSIQTVSFMSLLVFRSTSKRTSILTSNAVTSLCCLLKFTQIGSQFVLKCVWFHSFLIARFIHVITYSSGSFSFLRIFIAFIWTKIKQFIHSNVVENWDYFHIFVDDKKHCNEHSVYVFWCTEFPLLWGHILKGEPLGPYVHLGQNVFHGIGNKQDNLKCICKNTEPNIAKTF